MRKFITGMDLLEKHRLMQGAVKRVSKGVPLRILMILLLFAASAVPLSVFAQETEGNDQTIAADQDARDDAEIARRIRAIYGQIDGLSDISVSVRAGVVTLRGTVSEAQIGDQAVDLAQRVAGVVAVSSEVLEETSVSERLVPVAERLTTRAKQTLNYLPLVSVAILVWVLVTLLGWYLAGRRWPLNRIAPNAFIADLLRQIIRLAFFVGGATLALDILGATALLGTILGAAGIVGLAIGFAVRDTVENYIASILLSIRQPFRPKDLVTIEGFQGFVIRLTSRATILMDLDGNHIRIPNSTVFKSNITNFTRNPERRFSFDLGIASDADIDKALSASLDVLETLEFVLEDPAPGTWIKNIGASNIEITLSAWIDQTVTNPAKARSEAIRVAMLRMEAEDLELPEPIYRLRFDGSPPSQPPQQVRQRPRKSTPPPETTLNDTSVDRSVTDKVDQERAENTEDDLLRDDAPDEFGTAQQ